MNKSGFEQVMNAWLMDQLACMNNQKIEHYERAMHYWRINVARCRDLGIEAPPEPPLPTFDRVEPMPPGYWFMMPS